MYPDLYVFKCFWRRWQQTEEQTLFRARGQFENQIKQTQNERALFKHLLQRIFQ